MIGIRIRPSPAAPRKQPPACLQGSARLRAVTSTARSKVARVSAPSLSCRIRKCFGSGRGIRTLRSPLRIRFSPTGRHIFRCHNMTFLSLNLGIPTYKASHMQHLANEKLFMQNFRLKASYDTEKMSSSLAGPGSLRLMCAFGVPFYCTLFSSPTTTPACQTPVPRWRAKAQLPAVVLLAAQARSRLAAHTSHSGTETAVASSVSPRIPIFYCIQYGPCHSG